MIAYGTKVRLTQDVERYPHFIAKAGMTGEVVLSDDGMFAVVLDEYLSGADEWDNEVHWYEEQGDDLSAIPVESI
jgi:hypothetical protein